MTQNIEVTIRRAEGALIRTLGLIERRGFAVTSISTAQGERTEEMSVMLAVDSASRSVETLARQIEKLFDVCTVRLGAAEAAYVSKERVAC